MREGVKAAVCVQSEGRQRMAAHLRLGAADGSLRLQATGRG